MTIPVAYRDGFGTARALDPHLAERYVRQTVIGDPVADAVVGALAPFGPDEAYRLIEAGMERDAGALAAAPRVLRDFFGELERPPAWFTPEAVLPGQRAFHEHSDLFMPAFFVVTLQNAGTLIGKVFCMTGRVRTGHGLRRIRQNTRHFIEIMLPGALERHADGWKLSVRIRLIHAQIRRLIRESGKWDEAVYGVPLSAAHLAFASANFSATMLHQAMRLGADLDADARNGFMQVWRYASWLVGTPEDLLFEGDEARTRALHRVARVCEPPPNHESAIIANALVEALPVIAGMTDPEDRKAMTVRTYRIARALLGDDLADQLDFPRMRTTGLVAWMRANRRARRAARRLIPDLGRKRRGENFAFLLEAAMLGDLDYRMPDHLEAEKATPW